MSRFVRDDGSLQLSKQVPTETELGSRMGYMPRFGWKLLGEPWVPGEKDAWAKILAEAI